MASPGNQHCASCIGTLSFSISKTSQIYYRVTFPPEERSCCPLTGTHFLSR